MPMTVEKVAQLERQWREAREQLLKDYGRMYEIIRRKISAEEWLQITVAFSDYSNRKHPGTR